MRSVLALALSLLFVALLLKAPGISSSTLGSDGGGRAVHVLAAAKGRLLQPATYDGNPFANVIHVGDANLGMRLNPNGIRVAVLSPALEVLEHLNLDTTKPEGARALEGLCSSTPTGGVLVLASQGAVQPKAIQARQALQDVAERLGSEVAPFDSPDASWALVSVRRPERWIKVAESFSSEKGVVLTCTLTPDLDHYADYKGETFVDASGVRTILFAMELGSATFKTPGVAHSFGFTTGGAPKRSIRAPLKSIARWRNVPIGSEATFSCELGPDARSLYEFAARFSLWIDGAEVAAREIGADTDGTVRGRSTWIPWSVDLTEYEGRVVTLELRLEPSEPREPGARPVAFLWGAPTLESRLN